MDEEIRQAIESVREQQPVQVNLDWYQDTIKLPEIKEFIRANINAASRSFVAIGYYLKYVRDNQLYKEDGYTGISDFAKAEFGISAAQASKFISINDRFSKDGNSPVLLDQYKDFSSSKLSEMLYLTDEQLEHVAISTTVAEIREIKEPEKEISFSTSKTVPKSIDDIDFTVRTYNCLKHAGIDTVMELCELTEDEVIMIRNISRKCLDEIKLKLSEIGQGLKQDEQPETMNDIPETVNDKPEIVDNDPEIVNDVDETVIKEPENVITTNVFDCPCDTCGHEIQGCCDYDTKDDYCVLGNKWIPKEPERMDCDNCKKNYYLGDVEYCEANAKDIECKNYDPIGSDLVETVEADIIQTVPENNPSDARLTPMKLKHAGDCHTCPSCGAVMVAEYYTKQIFWNFCPYCGQAIIRTDVKTNNPDRPEWYRRFNIGLRDSARKYIREGDILVRPDGDQYRIDWDQMEARFIAEAITNRLRYADHVFYPMYQISDCKIVGSIYEVA